MRKMPLLATPALALAFAIGPALRIASPRAGLPCATAADSSVDASPSLKEQLVTAIGSDGLASAPSLNQQMEITEVIMALSSTNPTAEPARSPLLNGKWELQFSGAPGQGLADSPTRLLALALYSVPLSPSVLAQGLASLPFGAASLGSVTVEIVSSEAGQPRVTVDSSVSLLGGTSQPVRRWGLPPRSQPTSLRLPPDPRHRMLGPRRRRSCSAPISCRAQAPHSARTSWRWRRSGSGRCCPVRSPSRARSTSRTSIRTC